MKVIAIIGSVLLSLFLLEFVAGFYNPESGIIPFTNLLLISGWGALIYTELRTLRKKLFPPTKTEEDSEENQSCEKEEPQKNNPIPHSCTGMGVIFVHIFSLDNGDIAV